MLLIELKNIKKYYGIRLILDIPEIKLYSGDCIGIVGANGSGKTTLLDLMAKNLEPDEGTVNLYDKSGYVSQLKHPLEKAISSKWASKLSIPDKWSDTMSGGEKTKFKLALELEKNYPLMFADEPTTNVDIESISVIEEMFKTYKGTLIVISHDRSFLDKLCTQIIEVEDSKVKIYKGNYSDYKAQKEHQKLRAEFEHEEYIKEKKRLESVMSQTKQKSLSIKKAPKRMGNSEARLHKMGGQKQKAKLDKIAKSVKTRIEHLEIKEKPKTQSKIHFDIQGSEKSHSKILIEAKKLNKSFAGRVIFKDAEFAIENGTKTAIVGANGSGKTTLINMILEKNEQIKVSKTAKIGYFNQELKILKPELSIIENVMENSIYKEDFARLLLARLLFRGESVYKKAKVLSGGELVKVSFAKILLEDINMLILDEPTNYLDISSLEVIEEALIDYDKALLFVSHDRKFISSVANQIIAIEDKKLKLYRGGYEEYLYPINKVSNKEKTKVEEEIILKNRMAEVIGRLSTQISIEDKARLDLEYNDILNKLRALG